MGHLQSRRELFGLPIDSLTMEETVELCERLIAAGGYHQHVVLNAAKVVAAQDDPSLAAIIRRCAIVNADGQSIVWAARLLGQQLPGRVAGIDLMECLLESALANDFAVYFLGAESDVVRRVAEIAERRGVRVVGHHHGYWPAESEQQVVSAVASVSPDLLFLAMPSPRKEEFLDRHLDGLKANLVVGVGGSFDVLAGKTRRAPHWMQKCGLEWLFRLLQEPRRLLKRYLVGNSRYAALVLVALVKKWWRNTDD